MPWDEWRKDFNKKLDNFGEDAKHKYRQQREANSGGTSSGRIGVHDRMNMLKGENPRWNRDLESRAAANEAGPDPTSSTVVPETRSRVPPAPLSALNKGRPPPPPSRNSQTGAGASLPPPSLPPRMQNEEGTSNPPPPYPPTEHSYPTSDDTGHIQFSRFTRQDKDAFFQLLDEVSTQPADSSSHQQSVT
ncbi:uncharacterized protein MEPE_00988 [Melanopsichium pennsylvanicum]|uniref:Uncharacterized protein n=2 Tax=Melanopsichium pennsylvanicum TaxID=63383 RepID=A0AAJ4XH96_9BASI|nr:putative protein [Melanopsichium pennsylvanicum 4]SNX82282.1 uncharacterized protein MEPE_00988 [Melanopsichium pennsylvanicum]